MYIGSSIFLIAVGAILAFAITPGLIPYVDQTVVGYILMGAGVLGVILSLVFAAPRRQRTVSESRRFADPANGDTVTRHEMREDGI
ncbi:MULTISPECIES: DUF6458 family protein [Arthrobacter]|uniref:DUF6458 domain-containing protein n=1 Tax=Arthrobacter terricola TaxID=2547396 RepID=A0A4R5KNG5_9MICC|nr:MULTISPECIES: DUF6458 family protein [Arthrobacter]MBT8161351.1 hypothetical protein [Arthrobacter sp. GN70]TDF96130.1 hypothetical protein E1809_10815 [Arthrobacter terricola]